MEILDAKGKARLAANHVHVESADGKMGRNLVLVGFRSQSLRFCGSAGDEKVGRESSRGRIEHNCFAFEAKNREMSGSGGEMDFIVGRGAKGIVSGLEPLEPNERKPAVGLEKVRFVLLAPGGVVFLPGRLLRGCGHRQQREQKSDASQAGRTIPEAHEKVYRGREKAGNEGQAKEDA
jgi:hypothetical protein